MNEGWMTVGYVKVKGLYGGVGFLSYILSSFKILTVLERIKLYLIKNNSSLRNYLTHPQTHKIWNLSLFAKDECNEKLFLLLIRAFLTLLCFSTHGPLTRKENFLWNSKEPLISFGTPKNIGNSINVIGMLLSWVEDKIEKQ